MRNSAKWFLLLHLMLGVYASSSVCSKLAAQQPFLSVGFILLYGGMLAALVVYAFGWQQVIKRMPLIAAYANRAVTLVWGIVWGVLFFGEGVTPLKLLGAAIVLSGVVLFSLSGEEADHE